MIEIIDGQEQIITSIVSEKRKKLSAKTGIEVVQLNQILHAGSLAKAPPNKTKAEIEAIDAANAKKDSPEQSIKERIKARAEKLQREKLNIPDDVSVEDFLAKKRAPKQETERKKRWGEIDPKDYSKKSDYRLAEIEALKSNATIFQLEKKQASIPEVESLIKKEIKRKESLSERGMDEMSGGNRSTSKATASYGAQMAARTIDDLENYLSARKGLDRAMKNERTGETR